MSHSERDPNPSIRQRLQPIVAWLVVICFAVTLIAFCVTTFAQFWIPGWTGEQTEAWFAATGIAGLTGLGCMLWLALLKRGEPRD